MSTLDEDFENLIKEAMEKVQTKKEAGDYDEWSAAYILEKFQNILHHGDDSRYGYKCPDGHDDPDCGWSPSMGYHCS